MRDRIAVSIILGVATVAAAAILSAPAPARVSQSGELAAIEWQTVDDGTANADGVSSFRPAPETQSEPLMNRVAALEARVSALEGSRAASPPAAASEIEYAAPTTVCENGVCRVVSGTARVAATAVAVPVRVATVTTTMARPVVRVATGPIRRFFRRW